jgi:hypothetical protein
MNNKEMTDLFRRMRKSPHRHRVVANKVFKQLRAANTASLSPRPLQPAKKGLRKRIGTPVNTVH